jgi:hypothetical protein
MNQPQAPAVRADSVAPDRPEPPKSVVIAVRLMYAGAAVTAMGVLLSVIAVATGAWLFMARANRGGLTWARIIATVLFALGTWNLVSHLIGKATPTNLAYTALVWVAGLGAVFFLWHKDSSAYFN